MKIKLKRRRLILNGQANIDATAKEYIRYSAKKNSSNRNHSTENLNAVDDERIEDED